MNYLDNNNYGVSEENFLNTYGYCSNASNNLYTKKEHNLPYNKSITKNKIEREKIKLRDLLNRHSKYLKENKIFYYEVCDVKIKNYILGSDEADLHKKHKECLENGKLNRPKITIIKLQMLLLKVEHEGNSVKFIFEICDRDTLESWQNNKDVLEDFYTEAKKIGRFSKTKEGFNIKLNMLDAFRYRGANVFVYIKDTSVKGIKELKKIVLDRGFLENEVVYDVDGFSNFRSMYENSLKEGDLVVIFDLNMIDNSLDGLRNLFLGLLSKKVSFYIDEYLVLYDLYEESSKEEIITSMIEFFSFYLKKQLKA